MDLIYAVIMVVLIALDQASKYYLPLYLGQYGHYDLNSFLAISLTYNRGAAWSFLADHHWGIWFLTFCSLLCSLLIFYLFVKHFKAYSVSQRLCFTLILSGAIGNLIDRFLYQQVTDFIDFHIGSWHFPTFNLADSYLTIGVALVLILIVTGKLNVNNLPFLQDQDK